MIVIAGEVRIRPDQRDVAVRAGLAMMEATLREPGCRAYRFSAALDDPTCITIFEEWDSAEALEAHFASPHMATFRAVLPQVLAAPPTLARYSVERKDAM